MQTDLLQANWLLEQLCQTQQILIWPVLNYGYYPAFVNYHGSASLPEGTFIDTVTAILQSMQSAGAQRIAILNTGISTIPPLETAMAKLTMQRCALINCYAGDHYRQAAQRVIEIHEGSHADEEETSIMLALYPDKVKTDRLASGMLTEKQPGPFNIDSPEQINYAPNGIYGDARRASAEKGCALTEAMLQDVLESFRDLSA
jgi:creatinine amidohydrolase